MLRKNYLSDKSGQTRLGFTPPMYSPSKPLCTTLNALADDDNWTIMGFKVCFCVMEKFVLIKSKLTFLWSKNMSLKIEMNWEKGGKFSLVRLWKTYGQNLCAKLLSLQMVNKHMRRGREFCFDFGKISKSKCKQRKTFRLGFNRLELSRRSACFLHTWSTEMSKLTNNMQNNLFSNANDQWKNEIFKQQFNRLCFYNHIWEVQGISKQQVFPKSKKWRRSWFCKAKQTWQPRGILPNGANPDDFATGNNSWERLGKMLFTVKICSLFQNL